MNIKSILLPCLLFILISCSKETDTTIIPEGASPVVPGFTQYRILRNQHYAEQSAYTLVEYDQLNFRVKFDSTAVYSTTDPANQYDINKLYGFSDNDALHHEYSARMGWRWSDGALRLFAYVYNNGIVSYKELGAVSIGAEHSCSIEITANSYIFMVDSITVTMPRTSTTARAKGYKLFPYFGGDETAPHDISIWISEK